MSSRLSTEIAKLASEARRRSIRDHETIEKLTLIVGYGHLAENARQLLGTAAKTSSGVH